MVRPTPPHDGGGQGLAVGVVVGGPSALRLRTRGNFGACILVYTSGPLAQIYAHLLCPPYKRGGQPSGWAPTIGKALHMPTRRWQHHAHSPLERQQ